MIQKLRKSTILFSLLSLLLLLNGVPESHQQEAPAKPVVPASGLTLEQAMQAEKIIPELLSSSPSQTLQIQYLPGTVVHLGNELLPSKVRSQPRKVTWTASPTKLYTLLFLDLDSPSRQEPKFRSVLNWLVTNVPGSDIAKGNVRAEYIGAAPPKDTGEHRMLFLVYEQASKIDPKGDVISARSIAGRYNFKLGDFVTTNKLVALPVAGNFFVSRYDNYVPLLQGQLGLNRR